MNSIAAAIVYNFWLVREEFKKSDSIDLFVDFDPDLGDEQLSREQRIRRDIDLIQKNSVFHLNYTSQEVFFVFCGFLKHSNLRQFFGAGLVMLQEATVRFEEKLRVSMPDLHKKMCGSGVSLKHCDKHAYILDSTACLCGTILPNNLYARYSNLV